MIVYLIDVPDELPKAELESKLRKRYFKLFPVDDVPEIDFEYLISHVPGRQPVASISRGELEGSYDLVYAMTDDLRAENYLMCREYSPHSLNAYKKTY